MTAEYRTKKKGRAQPGVDQPYRQMAEDEDFDHAGSSFGEDDDQRQFVPKENE